MLQTVFVIIFVQQLYHNKPIGMLHVQHSDSELKTKHKIQGCGKKWKICVDHT